MIPTRIVTDWVTIAFIWIYYVFYRYAYSKLFLNRNNGTSEPETKSVSCNVRAVYRTFMISQRSERGRSSKETKSVKLKDEHKKTAFFQ